MREWECVRKREKERERERSVKNLFDEMDYHYFFVIRNVLGIWNTALRFGVIISDNKYRVLVGLKFLSNYNTTSLCADRNTIHLLTLLFLCLFFALFLSLFWVKKLSKITKPKKIDVEIIFWLSSIFNYYSWTTAYL